MPVLIEGISAVVKVDSIINKLQGGESAFYELVRMGVSYAADGHVACVTFMTPQSVKAFVEALESKGLTFKESEKAVDIAVVDQNEGLTTICDWGATGTMNWDKIEGQQVLVFVANGDIKGQVFAPKGWKFQGSLTQKAKFISNADDISNLVLVETDGKTDILMDRTTGKKYVVKN